MERVRESEGCWERGRNIGKEIKERKGKGAGVEGGVGEVAR